jgi:hypothetical protein
MLALHARRAICRIGPDRGVSARPRNCGGKAMAVASLPGTQLRRRASRLRALPTLSKAPPDRQSGSMVNALHIASRNGQIRKRAIVHSVKGSRGGPFFEPGLQAKEQSRKRAQVAR